MSNRAKTLMAALGFLATLITLIGFFTGRMTLESLLQLSKEAGIYSVVNSSVRLRADLSRAPETEVTTLAKYEPCATLAVSTSFELTCDGVPISPPLRYSGRERPQKATLPIRSPSGRYAFFTLCGADWCDDMQLVDLKSHRIASLAVGNRHFRQDFIWWSKDEIIALFCDMDLGWYELNAVDLRTGYSASLDSLFVAQQELYSVTTGNLTMDSTGCTVRVPYQTESMPQETWKQLDLCTS